MKTIAQLIGLGYVFEPQTQNMFTVMFRADNQKFTLLNPKFQSQDVFALAKASNWGEHDPKRNYQVAGLFDSNVEFPFDVYTETDVNAIKEIGVNLVHIDRMREGLQVLQNQQIKLIGAFYTRS